MLDLTKLNLYCFGLVSILSLLSTLRVVLWLCDENASSFVDFFCRHPPLLLLLLRHETFVWGYLEGLRQIRSSLGDNPFCRGYSRWKARCTVLHSCTKIIWLCRNDALLHRYVAWGFLGQQSSWRVQFRGTMQACWRIWRVSWAILRNNHVGNSVSTEHFFQNHCNVLWRPIVHFVTMSSLVQTAVVDSPDLCTNWNAVAQYLVIPQRWREFLVSCF